MEIDHVGALFEAPAKRVGPEDKGAHVEVALEGGEVARFQIAGQWKPVEREQIPDYIREPAVWNFMITNLGDPILWKDGDTWRAFVFVQVDRPRPAGQHKQRVALMRAANGEGPAGIILPH